MADENDDTRTDTDAAADDSMWGMEGSDLITWVYRIDEPSETAALRKSRIGHKYIARIYGDIDPERVREQVGGGQFKLAICRGRELVKNRIVEIEAPRKDFDTPPPAPVVAAPAVAPVLDAAALVKLMTESIAVAIAPLIAQQHAAPPAAPPFTFDTMLAMIDKIRPPARDRDPMDEFERHKTMFDSMNRAGSGGRSVGDAIVESMPHLVDVVDKVVTARVNAAAMMTTRAVRPPAARAAVPSAAVVPAPTVPGTPAPAVATDTPSEATAAPEADATQLTMISIADQVARALRHHTPPDDFADALELQFSAEELGFLRTLTPATIAATLLPYAGHFPELAAEGVEPYVAAVLEQLALETNDNGSSATVVDDAQKSEAPTS